jgi:hypothetical protein
LNELQIGPLAPIIGAIVGAVIASLVTYFVVVRRKSASFSIRSSTDLTRAIRRLHRNISVKIGDKEFPNLHQNALDVRNTGNSTIKDFSFQVMLSGVFIAYFAEIETNDIRLRQDITLTDEGHSGVDPVFNVQVPFLNVKERFRLVIFYSGQPSPCEVICRMEDLRVKVRSATISDELELDPGAGFASQIAFYVTKALLRTVEGFGSRF